MISPRRLLHPARGSAAAVFVVVLGAPLALPVSAGAGTAVSPAPSASSADGEEQRARSALTHRIAQRAGISLEAAEEVQEHEGALVQADGTVVIVDDADELLGHEDHAGHTLGAEQPRAGEQAGGASRRAAARSVDVRALHSNPGASQTIFLDVDGAELRDTDWNTTYRNLEPGFYGGYSLDADPALNPQERLVVLDMWRETSAFFAAFDVDVTTEQPSRDRIVRDGEADREFGTWVVVSTDSALTFGTCGFCGGYAQVGVYGRPDGRQWQTPAMAFIADGRLVAHEVGHQLGLLHDGGPNRFSGGTLENYFGHGLWNSVMGALTPDSLHQWSRGDYAGATNTQDDYAVMQDHGLVFRPDAVGGTVATAATRLGRESLGVDDTDVFALPACSGTLTTVAEVPDGGGLELTLELLDATGSVVARAATPMTLELPAALAPQREGQGEFLVDSTGRARFARITPGSVPGPEGYPTYGSIGGYRIDSRCDATAPGAPTELEVATTYRQATITWEPPSTGIVTGYRVTMEGTSQVVPAGVRQLVGYAIADSGVQVSVEALTGSLAGPAAGATLSFPPTPTVRLATPAVDRQRGVAAIAWDATVAPQIADAVWQLVNIETGEELVGLPVGTRSVDLGVLPPDGSIEVELCLLIPLGEASRFRVCDTGDASYAPLSAAPEGLALTSTDTRGGVGATWSPVAGATGYELSVEMGPWQAVSSPARVADVEPGVRSVRVRAVTASGPGSAARGFVEVRRAPTPPRDLVGVPSADGKSLALSWREPEDARDLTGYQLFVSQQDRAYPLPGAATSYTLTGLTPGTRVDVFLSAVGGNGGGSESAYLATSLPRGDEEPLDPGEPGVLPVPRLDSVTPGSAGKPYSISTSFSAAPHPSVTVTGWEARFTATGKPRTRSGLALLPQTRSFDAYLSRKRTWRVQVRAVGEDGEVGAWSARSAAVRPG